MRKIIEKKGITLISLVVTIIVMLVLAGITVNLVLNENNGIFSTAKKAEEDNSRETAKEKISLKITNSQMNSWAKSQRMPTLQELADDFCEDNEIQYVTLESQKVASLEKIKVGENDSIFTKLKDYPYEFEINSQLQLASVDGIKIATTTNDTQTTGVKEDAYICDKIASASGYGTVTSMSGMQRSTDENNKISEYLSFSSEKGYTVLKSGWYFVDLSLQITSSSASDINLSFIYNGQSRGKLCGWTSNGFVDRKNNNFSIFLKEGDNIYFAVESSYAASSKLATGYCYPMF